MNLQLIGGVPVCPDDVEFERQRLDRPHRIADAGALGEFQLLRRPAWPDFGDDP